MLYQKLPVRVWKINTWTRMQSFCTSMWILIMNRKRKSSSPETPSPLCIVRNKRVLFQSRNWIACSVSIKIRINVCPSMYSACYKIVTLHYRITFFITSLKRPSPKLLLREASNKPPLEPFFDEGFSKHPLLRNSPKPQTLRKLEVELISRVDSGQ